MMLVLLMDGWFVRVVVEAVGVNESVILRDRSGDVLWILMS